MYYTYYHSPIGTLLLAGRGEALEILGFTSGRQAINPHSSWMANATPFAEAVLQLKEYFQGVRRSFKLALAPQTTPFQRKVLDVLQTIPYGETRTYKEVAISIGNPKAVRAVGAANGRNPIPIIIPCHRVIGSDGALTGFGGGIDAKRALLQLESTGRALA